MGDLDLCVRRKITCSPGKSDAVNCEIAAEICQTLLQVVSGEEEEEKMNEKRKKKNLF